MLACDMENSYRRRPSVGGISFWFHKQTETNVKFMHNAPLYSYLYELTFGINLYSGTFPLTFLKIKKKQKKKEKTITTENFLERKNNISASSIFLDLHETSISFFFLHIVPVFVKNQTMRKENSKSWHTCTSSLIQNGSFHIRTHRVP